MTAPPPRFVVSTIRHRTRPPPFASLISPSGFDAASAPGLCGVVLERDDGEAERFGDVDRGGHDPGGPNDRRDSATRTFWASSSVTPVSAAAPMWTRYDAGGAWTATGAARRSINSGFREVASP